jgi:hypothetical protein
VTGAVIVLGKSAEPANVNGKAAIRFSAGVVNGLEQYTGRLPPSISVVSWREL